MAVGSGSPSGLVGGSEGGGHPSVHPAVCPRGWMDLLRAAEREGLDPGSCCLCHGRFSRVLCRSLLGCFWGSRGLPGLCRVPLALELAAAASSPHPEAGKRRGRARVEMDEA